MTRTTITYRNGLAETVYWDETVVDSFGSHTKLSWSARGQGYLCISARDGTEHTFILAEVRKIESAEWKERV